jgi:hypothetical protein
MTDEDPLDPIEAFAAIGQIKLSDTNLDGVLEHLARLAKRTIPGATEVSVTLSRGKGAYTAAFSGELALSLDETQYEQGHGPCLDALASGDTLAIDDMSSDDRWPQFAARAVDAGCHSSVSVGLPVHESAAGALNVYASKPQAFDNDAIALAQTFSPGTPPSRWPTPTCTTPRPLWRTTCRRRWPAAPPSSRPKASSWATDAAPRIRHFKS